MNEDEVSKIAIDHAAHVTGHCHLAQTVTGSNMYVGKFLTALGGMLAGASGDAETVCLQLEEVARAIRANPPPPFHLGSKH